MRLPLAVGLILSLAACEAPTAEAQEQVARQLRDPSSAEFRNVEEVAQRMGPPAVCGEVNARNGYGGYSGFQRFYVWNGTAHLEPADPGGAGEFQQSYVMVCIEGDAQGDLGRRLDEAGAPRLPPG